MSAVVRIDGQGSLPTFLDRAQAGLDRMVQSERNVKGALRSIGNALEGTSSSAQMASQAAEALADKFVRGIGATAAVAAFKILSDQISAVAQTLGAAGEAASKTLSSIENASTPKTFSEAASQAQSLLSAVQSIDTELRKVESNPFRNFIASVTGANDEMRKLAESLQRAADAQMALGFATEAENTKRRKGMSPDELALDDINERQKQRLEQANQIREPGMRQQAVDASFETFVTERNAKLDEIAQKAKESQKKADDQKAKDDKDLKDFKKKAEQDNADYQKKLLGDAALDEIQRARSRERMLDDFRRGLEEAKAKAAQMAADRMAAENSNRGIRGARASAATEILDRASGLGGGMEDIVAREREKQAAERQKNDREAFDRGVKASTSEFTDQGARRTMASRRNEFIAQQAKQEARGGKSLTDVYMVLENTLNKIISAPMVGGG